MEQTAYSEADIQARKERLEAMDHRIVALVTEVMDLEEVRGDVINIDEIVLALEERIQKELTYTHHIVIAVKTSLKVALGEWESMENNEDFRVVHPHPKAS